MNRSTRKKTLRTIIYPRLALIMLAILLIFTLFAGYLAKQFIYRQSEDNLKEVSKMVYSYLSTSENTSLDTLQQSLTMITGDSFTRITIIRDDGLVIADTDKDPALLENHGDRPEIIRAFRGIPNSVIRSSDSLDLDMFYFARSFNFPGRVEPYVLRIAMPYTQLHEAYRIIYLYIGIGSVLFILLSIVLFLFIDRKIEQPLAVLAHTAHQYADLDFTTESLSVTQSVEIQDVFTSMRNMALKINEQFHDVNAQKEALQAVLDGMSEAVLVLDDTGLVIQTNPAAQIFFGSSVGDSLLEKSYQQILVHTELDEIIERYLQFPHKEFARKEIKVQLKAMFFQVHLSRIGLEDNKHILIVLNDITALMHLEQVRKDFVANVSHELKTPVTSIKGFTETLLYSDLSEDQEKSKRFLSIINSQSDRLQAIIDDLLVLSRLEQSRDRTKDFTPIDLHQILEDAVQICKEKPGNEHRRISISCDRSQTVTGSSLLIEQAFINLIDNALKYSDDQHSVSVVCIAGEQAVRIEVRDQGYGIPESSLDRIFERFYRVDKGRSRNKGGTGLGLSIVRHIVLQHHGEVSVSSIEGKGSVFTITLPYDGKHLSRAPQD
jgi:two-component system, OmpR family, phosphate regulon sensor histidine kinase PhoR